MYMNISVAFLFQDEKLKIYYSMAADKVSTVQKQKRGGRTVMWHPTDTSIFKGRQLFIVSLERKKAENISP